MSDDQGGFFASFARSMLDRSLPRVREWMRQRFGPGAEVGKVEVRGPNVHVRGARLPLGARLMLEVDEAVLDIDPDAMVSGSMPVRFRRGRGTLRGDLGDERALTLPLTMTGRASPGAAWLDADLQIQDGRWSATEVPLSGPGHIVVAPDGWRVDALRLEGLRADGERERVEATVAQPRGVAPTLALTLHAAHAGRLLDTWHTIVGTPLSVPVPRGAALGGGVSFTPGGGTMELRLQTPKSALSLDVALGSGGALTQLSLDGELAPDDVPALAAHLGGAPMRVHGALSGPLQTATGTLHLTSASVVSPYLLEEPPLELAVTLTARALALHLSLGDALEVRLEGTLDGASLEGTGTASVDPAGLAFGHATVEAVPLTWALSLAGTRSAPQLRAHSEVEVLTLRRDEVGLPLRRAKLEIGWSEGLTGAVRARVGPGWLRLTQRPGHLGLRVERADLEAIEGAAALAGIALPPLPAHTQLWCDLTRQAGAVEGDVHLDTSRSCVTLAPLRAAPGEGFDGTVLRGTLALDELARVLAATSAAVGPAEATEPEGTSSGAGSSSSVAPSVGALQLEGALQVQGRVRGPRGAPYLDLTAEARRVEVRPLRSRPAVALRDLSAGLIVRADGLDLRTLSATVFGGALRVDGARLIREEQGLALEVGELTAVTLREGLGAWLGLRQGQAATLDVRLSGGGRAVVGEAHLRTDASYLRAALGGRAGQPAEVTLGGHVELSDLEGVGGTRGRVEIEGVLVDPWGDPRSTCAMTLGEGALGAGPLSLPLTGGRLEAGWSPGRFVWRTLELDLLAGRLHSRGVIAPAGVVAELQLDGLEVGQAWLNGAPLADWITGRLDGALRVAGRSPRGMRGQLTLRDPSYPGLGQATPALRRWGLPPLPQDGGAAPAEVAIEWASGVLRILEARASVPGLHVEGAGVMIDGALEGQLEVNAGRDWLGGRRSLGIVAQLLGGVTVPIRLGGDTMRPQITADLRAAFRIALARLVGREPAPSPPAPAHAPARLLGTDTLIDRVAAGESDADAALDALLERGLSPEEVADRVARRRRD